MKKILNDHLGWSERTVGTNGKFYVMVIGHVIFGILLFSEIRAVTIFSMITVIAVITVPIFYVTVQLLEGWFGKIADNR